MLMYAATTTGFAQADNDHNHLTRFKLGNGMEVLVYEDHHVPMAFSEVWYHVGAYREQFGKTGISHLLEHMMFQGTPKHPGQSFSQAMGFIGASFNATTSPSFTNYYVYMPQDKLRMVAEYEADRMANLTLDSGDFEREKQVVLEERYMRVDDQAVRFSIEVLQQLLFARNGYSLPVAGYPSDIAQLTVEDLRNWHQRWYRPSNAFWVVAGDVDPKEVRAIAEQTFGQVPRGTPPQQKIPAVPLLSGETESHVKVDAHQPAVLIGYLAPSPVTAENAPLLPWQISALQALLTGNRTAFLTQTLIEKKHLASDIGAYYHEDYWSDTALVFVLFPQEGVSNRKLTKAFDEALHSFLQTPIDKKQLAGIKASMLSAHVFDQDSLIARAEEIGYLHYFNQPLERRLQYQTFIDQLTPDNIRKVAKMLLDTDKRAIVYVDPKSHLTHS